LNSYYNEIQEDKMRTRKENHILQEFDESYKNTEFRKEYDEVSH